MHFHSSWLPDNKCNFVPQETMLENAISSNLHSRLSSWWAFLFLIFVTKNGMVSTYHAASLVMITSKNYLLKFNFTFSSPQEECYWQLILSFFHLFHFLHSSIKRRKLAILSNAQEDSRKRVVLWCSGEVLYISK